MGLLDDAIREHLDLKRRRGGDPVEIEREEQEALGPVRRAPEGAEAPPDAPVALDHEVLEYETEPDWDKRYADENEPLAADATVEHAAEPARDEPFDHAGPATSQAPPPDPVDHPGQETAEYDVGGHLQSAEDDPLEETPEFLQDTPEHDRLWFEQRPPKDFDFDG